MGSDTATSRARSNEPMVHESDNRTEMRKKRPMENTRLVKTFGMMNTRL